MTDAAHPPLPSALDNARLVRAAYEGNLAEIKRLARQGGPQAREAIYTCTVNEDGWSVLMLSALFCHLEVIEWLLLGRVVTKDEDGDEVEEAHEEEEEEEEEEEVDDVPHLAALRLAMVNQQDREGITAVFLAAYHNHHALLALLLQHGANPNTQHKDGHSPLSVAIFRGHLALVRDVLLPHPSLDINAQDVPAGRTALYHAAFWGKTAAVRLLLEEKDVGGGAADPRVPTAMGHRALDVARAKGHAGCVALLEVRIHT